MLQQGNLRHALNTLVHELTRPAAPFAVHDGRYAPLKEHGVLYYLAPRERNWAPAPWFAQSLHAQRAQLEAAQFNREAPTWERFRVMALIHWPTLLWQANPRSTSHLNPLVHELLYVLLPLIAQYDVVLATDIRRLQERRAAKTREEWLATPGYVGFDGEPEFEARFHTHLQALLRNTSFRYYLERTMEATLKPVVAADEALKLIRCPSGNSHRKGETCEACQATKWVRSSSTLIFLDKLMSRDVRALIELKLFSPEFYVPKPGSWNSEIRYWLNCIEPSEGVFRIDNDGKYGQYVLVNHAKLAQRAYDEGRDSPYRPLYLETDKHAWLAGARASAAMLELLGPRVLARRRKDLKDYVEEAGWEWQETLDIPYELYSVPQLMKRLEGAKKSVQHLLNNLPVESARKTPVLAAQRTLKVVHLEYENETGTKKSVSVVRRRSPKTGVVANYYTVPYAVTPDFAKERHVGLAARIGEQRYWNAHGLHEHAKRQMLGADHFLRWVLEQDKTLDAKRFEELRYQARYAERVARVLREKTPKGGVSAGRFMAWEDEHIRNFLLSRSKNGPLSEWDWHALLQRLPGRAKRGVMQRITVLGKAYFEQVGWVAYANSGLCLSRSSRKRAAWTGKRKAGKTNKELR